MDRDPKIKVKSAEIIIRADLKKPYYVIEHLKIGKDEYPTGYGSSDVKDVINWYNNCFELVSGELTPEESKKQKKYHVYDGSIRLVFDTDLDAILCLIKGSIDIEQCKEGV